jgi:hypothetical protein
MVAAAAAKRKPIQQKAAAHDKGRRCRSKMKANQTKGCGAQSHKNWQQHAVSEMRAGNERSSLPQQNESQ